MSTNNRRRLVAALGEATTRAWVGRARLMILDARRPCPDAVPAARIAQVETVIDGGLEERTTKVDAVYAAAGRP
jgi:hypothetical protein